MTNLRDIASTKKAVIFEFDDVLYPQKDYDLQVFYLFANLLEYLETFPPANDLLAFLKKRYELHGKKDLFAEAAKAFGIDQKYEENFDRLFQTAKLPLKLLLYKEALELLQDLVEQQKQLFILTAGISETQLNKLRQTEWNGLEKVVKIYFADELGDQALETLMEQNQLDKKDVLFVGPSILYRDFAEKHQIDFYSGVF